ncbi:MAG: hypothetical protein ABIR04_10010 [Cypionkella sp.]
MPDQTRDIELYQNEGALITLGATQIISFTRFDTSTSATVTFQDSAPNNGAWNAGESATIGGDPAILRGTGLSFAGVKVTILGITLANIQLSTPVRTALLDVDGSQMLHFYNADGSEADPAALLDALASQLVTSLSGTIPPLLPPRRSTRRRPATDWRSCRCSPACAPRRPIMLCHLPANSSSAISHNPSLPAPSRTPASSSSRAATQVPRPDDGGGDGERSRKSRWILPCIGGGAAVWALLFYSFLG